MTIYTEEQMALIRSELELAQPSEDYRNPCNGLLRIVIRHANNALIEIERLQQSQAEAERVAFNRGLQTAIDYCEDRSKFIVAIAGLEEVSEYLTNAATNLRAMLQPAPLQQAVTAKEETE